MKLERRPISLDAARRFVGEHHRHSAPPKGWKWGTSLADETGAVVAVAMAGRPTNRVLDDGATIEIARVCTLGQPNACSTLYAALCRAADALGYQRAITYLLADEDGASVKASGFVFDGTVKGDRDWSCPSRPRQDVDLFGERTRPLGDKTRWVRFLGADGARLTREHAARRSQELALEAAA